MKRIKITTLFFVFALILAFGTDTNAASPKMSKKVVYVTKGKSTTLKVKNTKKKIKWSIKNKKIAKVSSKGKITGKKKGTTYVYAKVGKKKLKCKVVVEVPKLTKKEILLGIDGKEVFPLKGTKRTPTYSSSNPKVATIDKQGNIVGVSVGTTTIKAKLNGKTYSCKVKVENPTLAKDTIILHKGENGRITVNGTSSTPTYSSNDETIVSVNKNNGIICAEDYGKTTINIKINNKILNCTIYVCPTNAGKEWLTNPTKYGDFRIKAQETYTLYSQYYQNHVDWINNGARALTNSPPVELDETLCMIATYRAYECIYGQSKRTNGNPYHFYLDGIAAPTFVGCAFYNTYDNLSEVLASRGGSEDITDPSIGFDKTGQIFYKSKSHTDNIQNPNHTKVGVGLASGNGRCYIVYVFK
jgi:hypothetical protein